MLLALAIGLASGCGRSPDMDALTFACTGPGDGSCGAGCTCVHQEGAWGWGVCSCVPGDSGPADGEGAGDLSGTDDAWADSPDPGDPVGDAAQDAPAMPDGADTPCGCLNTTVTYQGGLPETSLSSLRVYVLSSESSCDTLAGGNVPQGSVVADRTLLGLGQPVSFDCLPAGQSYTLYGTAKGPGGCEVAAGCTDGLFLEPGDCFDSSMALYLQALEVAGTFAAMDVFDFSNVVKECPTAESSTSYCSGGPDPYVADLPERVCCLLLEFEELFERPASGFVAVFVDVMKYELGLVIVETVETLLRDAVNKVVVNRMLNDAPVWLPDSFLVPERVIGMLGQVELDSSLSFTPLQNEFRFQGRRSWSGLAVNRKEGCDPEDPGYEACGRLPFTTADLADTQFPLAFPDSTFIATAVDFDDLVVDAHSVPLDLGHTVLYLLNEVEIRHLAAGKARTTRELAGLLYACPETSAAILAEISSWFGGTQADIEAACNRTIDHLLARIDAYAALLAGDGSLSVQGKGSLVDGDCNRVVESVVGGKWVGAVTSTFAEATFMGTFHAERVTVQGPR